MLSMLFGVSIIREYVQAFMFCFLVTVLWSYVAALVLVYKVCFKLNKVNYTVNHKNATFYF